MSTCRWILENILYILWGSMYGNRGVEVEVRICIPKVMSSIPPCARSWFFSQGKSPESSGIRNNAGKFRNLSKEIPGPYWAIIFPFPDRLVRRHPVRVAESCVRSCNSVCAEGCLAYTQNKINLVPRTLSIRGMQFIYWIETHGQEFWNSLYRKCIEQSLVYTEYKLNTIPRILSISTKNG